MPVSQTTGSSSGHGLRVAGLILRRNPDREFHTYLPLLPYQPSDYQILLRTWPMAPFRGYLGAFSAPVIAGQDPAATLTQKTLDWTRRLAQQARLGEEAPGVSVKRAEFISVHGGGSETVDPLTGEEVDMGITFCFVLPTTTRDSSMVARYPTGVDYPQFYDLSAILQGMMTSETVKVHPFTREMLSSLDKWLRERHALAGSINYLFSPSLESRLKMCVSNPLHNPPPVATSNHEETREEGNETIGTADIIVTGKGVWPISSSTPFQRPSDDSTLHETTAFSVAKLRDSLVRLDQEPADIVIQNPLFGSGVDYNQVDAVAVNRYHGKGVPNYDMLGQKRGKWSVLVEGDGMPDWIDLFPLHKCACEGDVEGVRKCVKIGVSPNERDTDSWTALHYACWYGELEVVKVLVGEASADLGVMNNTGSTPLHLAAATGHSDVVQYLLQQPGILMVQTAIDCEGKSPLAVCLECREEGWSRTAELLREAYARPTAQQSFSATPSLFSPPERQRNPQFPSPEPIQLLIDDVESLGDKGSLASHTTRKPAPSRKKSEKLVRRQRVDLVTGRHHLALFPSGRDTPTKHVLQDIYRLIQLAPQHHDMVALWIQSDSLEIQLGDSDKPLQLMSTWPLLLAQHVSKTTTTEIPKLCLRRNVFISPAKEKSLTDPTILELLYADAKRNVLEGLYPCSEEEAIELGGLTVQVSYGDHVSTVHHSGFLQGKLQEVLPVAMATSRRRVEFERRVLAQHSSVTLSNNDSQASFYKQYLKKCWQWPFYGAAFFPGSLATKSCRLPTQEKLSRKAHVPVNIAVNTFGFHLVSTETKSLIVSLSYGSVEWDASAEKHCVLLTRSDKTLHIEVQTRMAGLFLSLVSRMTEQYHHGSHANQSTPNNQ